MLPHLKPSTATYSTASHTERVDAKFFNYRSPLTSTAVGRPSPLYRPQPPLPAPPFTAESKKYDLVKGELLQQWKVLAPFGVRKPRSITNKKRKNDKKARNSSPYSGSDSLGQSLVLPVQSLVPPAAATSVPDPHTNSQVVPPVQLYENFRFARPEPPLDATTLRSHDRTSSETNTVSNTGEAGRAKRQSVAIIGIPGEVDPADLSSVFMTEGKVPPMPAISNSKKKPQQLANSVEKNSFGHIVTDDDRAREDRKMLQQIREKKEFDLLMEACAAAREEVFGQRKMTLEQEILFFHEQDRRREEELRSQLRELRSACASRVRPMVSRSSSRPHGTDSRMNQSGGLKPIVERLYPAPPSTACTTENGQPTGSRIAGRAHEYVQQRLTVLRNRTPSPIDSGDDNGENETSLPEKSHRKTDQRENVVAQTARTHHRCGTCSRCKGTRSLSPQKIRKMRQHRKVVFRRAIEAATKRREHQLEVQAAESARADRILAQQQEAWDAQQRGKAQRQAALEEMRALARTKVERAKEWAPIVVLASSALFFSRFSSSKLLAEKQKYLYVILPALLAWHWRGLTNRSKLLRNPILGKRLPARIQQIRHKMYDKPTTLIIQFLRHARHVRLIAIHVQSYLQAGRRSQRMLRKKILSRQLEIYAGLLAWEGIVRWNVAHQFHSQYPDTPAPCHVASAVVKTGRTKTKGLPEPRSDRHPILLLDSVIRALHRQRLRHTESVAARHERPLHLDENAEMSGIAHTPGGRKHILDHLHAAIPLHVRQQIVKAMLSTAVHLHSRRRILFDASLEKSLENNVEYQTALAKLPQTKDGPVTSPPGSPTPGSGYGSFRKNVKGPRNARNIAMETLKELRQKEIQKLGGIPKLAMLVEFRKMKRFIKMIEQRVVQEPARCLPPNTLRDLYIKIFDTTPKVAAGLQGLTGTSKTPNNEEKLDFFLEPAQPPVLEMKPPTEVTELAAKILESIITGKGLPRLGRESGYVQLNFHDLHSALDSSLTRSNDTSEQQQGNPAEAEDARQYSVGVASAKRPVLPADAAHALQTLLSWTWVPTTQAVLPLIDRHTAAY